ncbi:MAG: T9SS type A sorting domain-containing protein [Bacteroidia bacterium]|nr:T9SS type A sorting domain-containing protein [Bacteroidia bacterium]
MKKYIIYSLLLIYSAGYAQNWLHYDTGNSNAPYNGFGRIDTDTTGHIWFGRIMGSSAGKTVYFDRDTTWVTYDNLAGTTSFSPNVLKVDHRNIVWVLGVDRKIYSLKEGVWTKYDPSLYGINAISFVYDMAIDKYNNKWFASPAVLGGGLVKYNDTAFTLYDTSNSNLPFPIVSMVNFDKNNDMWILGEENSSGGASARKLAKFDGVNWHVFSAAILPVIYPRMMVSDTNSHIWMSFSTAGNGIFKFDGTGWTNINTSNSNIPTNNVWGMNVDMNNNIWISYTPGLSKFDGVSWTNYSTNEGYPYSTGGGYVKVDKYNNVWASSSSGVVVFNENGIVGVEEKLFSQNFILYPNPASSTITIESTAYKVQSIRIVDILGREVYYLQTTNNKTEIDVSHLPSGVYFVKAQNKDNVLSKKFVKQ